MKSTWHRTALFFIGLVSLTALRVQPAAADTQNLHLGGSIPLENSANDFHVRVLIDDDFLLGEPINLVNGPFANDGVVNSSDSGFTVDWGGVGTPVVNNGGPYDFGFDFVVNGPFTVTEAWWTINGARVVDTDGSTINDGMNYANSFQAIPIPEPASATLFTVAATIAAAYGSRREKQ